MKPKIRSTGHFHRWITAACMVFIAFVLASCPKGKPFGPLMIAQEIVFRHAEGAFGVGFDWKSAEDSNALNRFFEATKDARTKVDLERAWAAIPELAAKHPDFLEKKIFSKAADDGDWPGSDSPLDQKVVFVDGVRQALKMFLEMEGER